MMRVLVAGATGRLGMRLVRRLRGEGCWVRALVREPERIGLLRRHIHEVVQGDLTTAVPPEACEGIDVVFSCAGASTRVLDGHNESSFESVNHYGNVGLLRAALRARVQRFLYVAPLGADRLAHTAFGGAHERFVEVLHRSPMSHTVIRPTVYFEHVDEAVTLLRAGHGWTLGSGGARTNPIHEADLADYCVGVLDAREDEVAVGGPAVFTRDQVAALARQAVAGQHGEAPAQHDARAAVASALRVSNRRVRELLEFSAEISRMDVVGPPYGAHDLQTHLLALNAGRRAAQAVRHVPHAPRYGPLLALDVEPIEWQRLLP